MLTVLLGFRAARSGIEDTEVAAVDKTEYSVAEEDRVSFRCISGEEESLDGDSDGSSSTSTRVFPLDITSEGRRPGA